MQRYKILGTYANICIKSNTILQNVTLSIGRTDTPHYENVPFEIPASWEWVRLEDVAEIARGGSPRPIKQYLTTAPNGINWIKIGDSEKGGKYINSCKEKIIPEGIRRSRLVHAGDFLLTNSMSFGRPYILNIDGCIHDGWLVISPMQGIYDKNFLYYLLSSTYAYNQFSEKASGSAVSNLNIDKVENAFFPIAPIQEQKRIVAILEKWYERLEELESDKQYIFNAVTKVKSKVLDLAIHGKLVPQDPNDEPAIDLLKRINPSFKPSDTSHYENLPKGWTISTVGEVADYINGRAFKPSEWEQTGLPIIRIQNLNDEEAAYNYSTAQFEDKYLVHNGDLLFAWAASLGTYIWQKEDAWLNQHIFKVIPKPFIERDFLYYSFMNMIDDFYAESHGSGMVHITKGKFETSPIPVPPLAEQKRIVERIETIFAQLGTITAEL